VKPGTKPAAGAGANTSLLGTIKAAHGMRQITYAGFPLYFFAGDTKAGQVKGQGFQSQWYVVNATGALVKHAATPAADSPAPAPAATSSSSGDAWG
jgi:hypothetical protein